MPDRQAVDDEQGNDLRAMRVRLAGEWHQRFVLSDAPTDADDWTGIDPWAFAEWPNLAQTLARLRECAEVGAIGAAFDAIQATEAHCRRFWREAQKPIRPVPDSLLAIAAALPTPPAWALQRIGQHIAEGQNLKLHRTNITHRLRAWAVAGLADVREAHSEERDGNAEYRAGREGLPPLWKRFAETGAPETEAYSRATKELRRFTPSLLEKRKYDRVREILEGTPLLPPPRKKERDGESAPDGDTLRASVRLVEKAFREGWQSRFYLPSDRTLCALGMPDLAGWPAEIDRRIGTLFARP